MSPAPDSFYYLLSPLFIAAVSLGLAIVVLVVHGSRRNSSRWIFCALLLSVALYSFLIFGLRSSPDVHRALVWERAVTLASFIPYLLYYHFTVTYTGTSNKTQRRIVFASYLYLAIVSALVATDLLIKGMYIGEQGYFPILGPLVVPLTMVQLFWLGGGVYNFLKRYKVSRSSEERKRILYLTVAIFLPLAGAVSDAFTNLPPLAIWGNLMFCIICIIAIVKYHFLDIHIIIRRGATYLLASATIATPYVAIILIVNHFFVGGLPVWVHFALLVFLALVLQPFWIRIQQVVDRWFYRDRYDYLRALEQFGHETRSIAKPDELASTLVKLVSGALRSTMTCLLLPSKGKSGLAVASYVGLDNPPPGVVIMQQGRLMKWLKLHGRILSSKELDFIPELQDLSETERHNLESLGAELYVPIRTRDNELCGVLVLGEKLSQQPYFDDDRQLLATLANQMAMNLENARLYDSERTMRKELQNEAEQKTQFLHSVAHELKTPLTAVISSSESLATKPSSTTARQRLIHNITRSAWLMDKRVTELLDLARIQVGGLTFKLETLDIGVIIEEVASQLLPLFKNKEQSLKLEVLDSLPQVEADRERLEQVLVNFLSNANKFSPTGGSITLRAREGDNKVVVEVEDSAPLITKKEKEKLFNPYYRGEDADKKHISGLGLGLTIAKKLVELHQGEIWVEGKPGKGNIFAFSLPT